MDLIPTRIQIGTHPSGVTGISVESAPGKSVQQLANESPVVSKYGQVRCCTVKDIRAAGGDVVPTAGASPNHATLSFLTPKSSASAVEVPMRPIHEFGACANTTAGSRARRTSPPTGVWLAFHQQHSGLVMEHLHQWLEAQFALHQVEPNSGLGKAITYLLRHWKGLTAFLREAGAPLDNNVCDAERYERHLGRRSGFLKSDATPFFIAAAFVRAVHSATI